MKISFSLVKIKFIVYSVKSYSSRIKVIHLFSSLFQIRYPALDFNCNISEPKIKRDDLTNPFWMEDQELKKGNVDFLSSEEELFWKDLIDKYLYPLDATKKQTVLRNNNFFYYFLQINTVLRVKWRAS